MRILELENIIPKTNNSMFGFNSRDDRIKLMNLGINQQNLSNLEKQEKTLKRKSKSTICGIVVSEGE